MFTIKKIWNALNHAGKPWQIAMAIALGMLVGFTPLLSLHNIVVIFAVFIFNIHLSIFILAVSFFGMVGLLLDPLFAYLGKSILLSQGYEQLFTTWFNDPIGHLTYFNNTITMGSFVISLLLFSFVYKLSSVLITKYRIVIAVKLKNIPILNKIDFFQQEDIKEVKTVRALGIIALLIVIGLVSLFTLFFLDNIIKSNIETAINKSSSKIVKIGNLSTSFFNSSVVLENLTIQDSKDNSNNTNIKSIILDINLGQLVFEKVIIDNLKIDGISFPSKAEIKGANTTPSSEKITVKKKEKSNSDITAFKDLNNINVGKGFDKEVKNQFEKYKKYYEQIKPLFNKESEIVKNRDDGKFIYYTLQSNLPDLLIRKGTFSVAKDNILIKGSFKDFTTNQFLYKKPFVILIDTKTEKLDNILLNASFLETKDIKEDTFNIKVNGFELAEIKEKTVSINNTKLNSVLDLKIIDQNKITGFQSIKIISTDIVFPESNKYIVLLNKSLIQTKGIKGDITISGSLNNPKFKINSNIDKILKEKVKRVLKSQKSAIKDEIKTKVKEKLKNKLKGILGF